MRPPTFLGVDFGWRNPFAAVFCVPVRGGERILVVDEHYQTLRTVRENGRAILAKMVDGGYGWLRQAWADPSRPDSIAELAEALGIPVLAAPAVGVEGGQRIVSQWLKSAAVKGPDGQVVALQPPGLVIHQRCVNLLREIKAYKEHDPGGGEHHLLDGLRYFLVGWTRG